MILFPWLSTPLFDSEQEFPVHCSLPLRSLPEQIARSAPPVACSPSGWRKAGKVFFSRGLMSSPSHRGLHRHRLHSAASRRGRRSWRGRRRWSTPGWSEEAGDCCNSKGSGDSRSLITSFGHVFRTCSNQSRPTDRVEGNGMGFRLVGGDEADPI